MKRTSLRHIVGRNKNLTGHSLDKYNHIDVGANISFLICLLYKYMSCVRTSNTYLEGILFMNNIYILYIKDDRPTSN